MITRWRICVERLDPSPSGRALGDNEDPNGLNGPVLGLRDALGPATEGGSSSLDGIEGIGLAAAPALGPVGPVDLDHLDVCSAQKTGQARSIRAGALDADLGHVTEAFEPRQQGFVAGGVGIETLRAEQCSERVEGGGDMDVEVGIDTTGHTRAQLLRWSWSSLLLTVLGMARPFRIGATGGLSC